MAYHRQQGVDTAIVRIFNTYGPRMRPHDGRAIPTFLRQALQDRPITVFGDGSQTRSFCYVDDLSAGMIALAESGYHEPVNIGNPNEFTLLELAEAVIEVTGSQSEIVFEALPTDDPQVRQPDITLARRSSAGSPEIELREGLRRTIEQVRTRGAWSARPRERRARHKRARPTVPLHGDLPRNFEPDTVTTCGGSRRSALLSVTIDHNRGHQADDWTARRRRAGRAARARRPAQAAARCSCSCCGMETLRAAARGCCRCSRSTSSASPAALLTALAIKLALHGDFSARRGLEQHRATGSPSPTCSRC